MKKILFAFLFVLSGVNAALAAEFLDIKANQCAITNGQIVCQYIPQRLQDYIIIGGTIVQPESYEPFLPRVTIRFVPDDKNAKTLTTNAYTGSPTFSLALKPEESGTLYFDIISQEALETYANPDPIKIPKNFNPDNFKSLQVHVKYKNNSTRKGGGSTTSTTRTGGGSSGTTTAGDETKDFSAKIVYEASSGNYKPLVNVTITDKNNRSSTPAKSNPEGNFTIKCVFKKGHCTLLFQAKDQPQYETTVSESDNGKRIPYANYNSTPTRNVSGSGSTTRNTSSGTDGSGTGALNTITGTILLENSEPAIGATISPRGQTLEHHNSAVADTDGHFEIINFPRNADAEVSYLQYKTRIIPASELRSGIVIRLEPDSNIIDAATISAVKCGEAEKKQFNATAVKVLNNEKCIPAACLGGYTLERQNTVDAYCKLCQKSDVPFARDVTVDNNRCVARNCLDGFREQSGACVVDCSSSRAKNYLHATAAALKSNAPTPSANETAQSLDYSKYCYPTECDTPKYAMNGSGENAVCLSTTGTDCKDYIQHATAAIINNGVCELQSCEDGYAVDKYALGMSQKCDAAGHANDKCNAKCEYQIGKPCNGSTLKRLTGDDHADKGHVTAFVGGQITACEIDDCDSKDYEAQKGTDGKNHCVRVAGTPCDIDANLPHAKTHLKGKAVRTKNDVIACEPVCWENYKAKLNGTAYECVFDKKTCPNRITNPDARKMEVTPDDKYWNVNTGDIATCKITECSDKTKVPDENGETCVKKCTDEVEKQLISQNHALETTTNKRGECIISKCECGYNLSSDKKNCTAWGNNPPQCDKRSDPRLPDNAKKAHMACDNSTPKQAYCYIDTCESALFEIKDGDKGLKNAICVSIDSDCTVTDGGQYASKEGFWELTKNGQKICVPKDCGAAVGYEVSKKTRKCEEVKKTCPDDILSKMDPKADDGVITERNSDGSVKTCQITKCKDNLDVEDGKMCVSSKCGCGQVYSGQGQCKDKDDTARQCNKGLPAHATGMGKLMCQNNNKAFNLTCAKGEKCKEVCVVQQCEDPYTPDTVNNICTAPNGNCDFEGNKDHAEAKGTWEQKSGKMVCKPICKGSNYEPQWDNQTKTYTGCVQKSDHIGKKCPDNLLSKYPHASKLEISKEDPNGVATECKITACDKGYNLNEPNNSCDYCGCGMIWDKTEQKCKAWSDTKCNPMPTGATAATRACKDASSGEEKDASACQSENACVEFCKVTGCDEPAYTLVDGACKSSVGMPCPQLPEHATAGILNDKLECVVSACENGYEISPSGLACNAKMVLTKDQYQEKVAALADNAQKMRDKETSLENRIIGAAGIGMTGIGGTMVGSALSERAADISAEQAMAAYLQTFHCEYGDGKNIKGGEVNVELPGGNDMIELYQEYAQLANDLKIRKEALGIRPGIESEVVIDKSETGLYEYTPDGIDGGVYASIARAILYPDGEDAAMWAAQRAATQKKLVAGAVVAGVGAVGSGVANYVVNHDNPNKSDEIIKKYELMKQPFEHMQDSDNKQPEKTCAEMYPGATGSNLKNCRCTAQNAYLTNDGCIQCGPGFRVNDEQNGCICADSTKIEKDGQCVEELPVTPAQEPTLGNDLPQECKLAAHLKEQQECKCVAGAIEEGNNKCTCNTSAGYVEYENSCICDSARGYTSDTNGNCTCNTTAGYTTQADGTCAHTASNTGTSLAQASLRADATQHALFDSGKATLKDTTLLDTFITDAKATNIDLSKPEDYCIVIIGKTDHQGFKSTSKYYGKGGGNQQLSTDRAKAVADYLAKKGVFANDSIRSYGIAATECPEPAAGASKANQECRRVDIKMLAGSCTTNFVNLANLLNTVAGSNIVVGAVTGLINQQK
ncbi:MAG: OmpA family protein [Alphaproteobacteria bacterium]|nr:OmpA family protein [Alphaproteobacteria bacterium]